MIHIRTYPTVVTGADEDGFPIIEAVDGVHIDTLEAIDGAEEYIVHPETPQHSFAGVALDKVHRYKFSDEEAYKPFDPLFEVESITNSEVL